MQDLMQMFDILDVPQIRLQRDWLPGEILMVTVEVQRPLVYIPPPKQKQIPVRVITKKNFTKASLRRRRQLSGAWRTK